MLTKLLRRGAIAIAGLALVGVGTLAVIGVPTPPTITKVGLGRVGWGSVLVEMAQSRRQSRSRSLVTWAPDGSGMLGWSRSGFQGVGLHVVPAPGSDSERIPGIPVHASGFHGGADRPYLIMAWDTDGLERDQLFMWDPSLPSVVQITSGDAIHSFGAFETNGPRIAYTRRPGSGDGGELRTVIPGDPASNRHIADLEYGWTVTDWAPSGGALLIQAGIDNEANHLLELDVATGEFTRLLEADADSVLHRSGQYDRAGDGVYYTSDRASEFLHLRRLDLDTGQEEILTEDLPWDVMSVEQSQDGTVLLLEVLEDAERRYHLLETTTGERRVLDLFEDGIVGMQLHPSRSEVIVNHTDPRGVFRGYVHDLGTGELTRWVGPEAEPSDVPRWRRVRYPTFDSVDGARRTIPALVYPGVGERPGPVIVDIHGGPHTQALLSMGYTRFQRRGITYIRPNIRGSTGYGKSFKALDNGRGRSDAVRDVGALLDWIETQPDLDADRVMLRGVSYGGFMVYASLVDFGERVRCAKVGVGVTHPVTFLENLAGPLMGGGRPEWGDESDPVMRSYLDSIAPLSNAHRIRTDLMITHGVNDRRVPVGEARQMVEALEAGGLPVAYLEASDEGHGFRKPRNVSYEMAAEGQMIDRCLLR